MVFVSPAVYQGEADIVIAEIASRVQEVIVGELRPRPVVEFTLTDIEHPQWELVSSPLCPGADQISRVDLSAATKH